MNTNTNESIPKILHFIWLGNNPKSKEVIRCIDSWKKHCPDFQIIEWGNDILKEINNEYAQEAYENKMYAFASDVIRLYVLNKYGGIYLDTDVEITAPLNEFLNDKFFVCCENYNYSININTGLIGTVPKHKIISDLLNQYKNTSFVKKDKTFDLTPNPTKFLKYFKENYSYDIFSNRGLTNYSLKNDGVIYPYWFFCKPQYSRPNYAIHYFAGSWCEKSKLKLIERIFSIKNSQNRKHKIITIIGIKIKIKSKTQQEKNQYILLNKKLDYLISVAEQNNIDIKNNIH